MLTLPSAIIESRSLRHSSAVISGMVMTFFIFLLMYQLIGTGIIERREEKLLTRVNIYQAPPEQTSTAEIEPNPILENLSTPTFEPTMTPLQVNAPSATPVLKVAGPPVGSFEPSVHDIGFHNIGFQSSGSGSVFGEGIMSGSDDNTWTPPGDADLAKKIAGASGYKEVLPRATRQPNVPEYAWLNKIDGWVLVAFTVNANGYVENVRVLDAHPRGVFEENVIASVKHWVYSPADIGGKKMKVQLTQRIELFWKDYPNNNTQLQ